MLLMIITSNGIFLITSVSLAIGLGGLAWASFGVNHLDVGGGVLIFFSHIKFDYFFIYSSKYANVLMSVSNTFASLPGIISPILTGHLIENRVILFFI
jgi:ACS family sodium-dependent inorganic phosphate cotransporter